MVNVLWCEVESFGGVFKEVNQLQLGQLTHHTFP